MVDTRQGIKKHREKKNKAFRSMYRIKSRYIGLVYISPWLIGFFIFQFYPLISSFVYSFMNFNMFDKREFIGIQNYIYMFTKDELFRKSLKVTFIYVFLSVPLKLVSALLVAMLLNMKLKFVNFFRTVYYIPSIMGGSVAISILWKAMFMKEGYINSLLSIFSIPATNWLGDPSLAIYTLSVPNISLLGFNDAEISHIRGNIIAKPTNTNTKYVKNLFVFILICYFPPSV